MWPYKRSYAVRGEHESTSTEKKTPIVPPTRRPASCNWANARGLNKVLKTMHDSRPRLRTGAAGRFFICFNF